jgi:hypothetical protein
MFYPDRNRKHFPSCCTTILAQKTVKINLKDANMNVRLLENIGGLPAKSLKWQERQNGDLERSAGLLWHSVCTKRRFEARETKTSNLQKHQCNEATCSNRLTALTTQHNTNTDMNGTDSDSVGLLSYTATSMHHWNQLLPDVEKEGLQEDAANSQKRVDQSTEMVEACVAKGGVYVCMSVCLYVSYSMYVCTHLLCVYVYLHIYTYIPIYLSIRADGEQGAGEAV